MAVRRNFLSRVCCLLAAACLFAGCHVERIVLEEPVRDRFVEVDTEDHVVVRLDENAAAGCEWTAKCADPLVDVTIGHEPGDATGAPGLATVHLRVRRGFIGPAVVYMRHVCRWSGKCVRTVKLHFHRRPTDVALWR